MSKVTLNSNINSFLRKLQTEVENAMEEESKILLEESKPEVPVDTGELRDSGYVKTTRSSTETKCEIGYSADYAIYVHENYNASHPNGGNAGFLLNVFKRREEAIIKKVGNKINRIL